MRPSSWITQYLLALVVFFLLDFLWLGTVAPGIYEDRLGDLMADQPNVGAAVAFYLLFVAGLVFFVIHPAVAEGSWVRALLAGAFFGLVTYATWDLTNLAVIQGFPGSLVPIDMAWGTALAAGVSVATYAAARALPDWAR